MQRGSIFVAGGASAHFEPIQTNRRSSLLIGRIFFDEPVSTSSENASCLVAFSSTNRRPLRRKGSALCAAKACVATASAGKWCG